MQAVVSNLLTSYELQGKGKLVLFLHGWGDNSSGSTALQKTLAQSYTVLAPDLPGFGKTQTPTEAWNLDNYASFLNELLKKLDLPQPYAVIGHSNGGAIATRATALGALKPEKLVLLAASGIRSTGGPRRALLRTVAKTGKLATIVLPNRHRQALRRRLYASAGSDMLVVEGMGSTFKNIIRHDVQADAQQLTLPTLLLFGSNDQAVPPFMANRYHALIKKSQLHMLEAGHFVHLDQPQQTTNLIKDFL